VTADIKKQISKPQVLLVSNHHAREVVTPELAYYFAKQLVMGSDADTLKIMTDYEILIIPTMNPDGLHAVYNGNGWKRTNANNVDLNRNYPVGWSHSCAGESDQSSCTNRQAGYICGETFRGSKPFSEVETQTMRALQQDRNFVKLLDFHSYGEESRTNYGPCDHLPQAIDQLFQTLNQQIAGKMRYSASRSCCMGGDIHYAYNRHGSLAYLLEAGQSFQPSAETKNKVLAQVWPGVKHFLQIPIPVYGKILARQTGDVLAGVKISIPGYKWNLSEVRQSGKDGRYHLWLPAGEHKIVIQPQGKQTKEVTIVAKGKGHYHDIEY